MADSKKPRKYWKPLLAAQKGICPLCLLSIPPDPGSVHVDHKVPQSKGGTNDTYNLQAVHTRCNLLKWNRSDDEAREHIAAMLASGEY